MMEKYQNKYRIKSHRMPNWDYSNNGMYYITLVTQNRKCNLGEIMNNKMILSDFGKIIETEWLKSFKIRDELFCDEYIIMPNHLHAIVVLEKPILDSDDFVDGFVDGFGNGFGNGRYARPCVSTANQSNPQKQPKLIREPKSISSFIGGYKSVINSKIDDYIDENKLNIPKYNRNNHFFQPNYHDRIIRNTGEYERIKNYIINNPLNWNNDKLENQRNQ